MLRLLYNCRAMLCKKRDLCRRAVSVCPSVLLSVTFVYCVKMSNRIFKLFFTVE